MKFRMNPGGEEVQGRSYEDVVVAMADLKLEAASSLKRYRRSTAQRVSETFGKEIDPSTDESFVKSLEEVGLLERM